MDVVPSPTSHEKTETTQPPNAAERVNLQPPRAVPRERTVNETTQSSKPPMIRHISSPAYSSPLRHHHRKPSTPHKVKESLNARSEYVTSQDDGAAEHRINQYTIKQEIGRGSFGAVHLAVDQYGTEFAVKEFSKARLRKRAQSHILRKPLNQRRRALQEFNSPLHRRTADEGEQPGSSLDLIKEEIAIMKKLHHHNLVSLIEVLDDPSEDSLYMVMEMCKKGVVMKVGLDQQADPYPDEACRYWFRDLILGIEYLHAEGIVHRDIKPDNCLINHEDVLKVVDFGVSEMFEKDSEMLTAKSAGSPAFLPPELCVVKHGDVSGKAADIWSMGVTLYCLKYGSIPFKKDQIFELYESIKSDQPDLSMERDPDFRDLMTRILEKDPARRIKMPELREHPWVTKGGTDRLLSEAANTVDVVGPPTDAEVEAAITGNMRSLLTVVKAVNKFRSLIGHTKSSGMTSILGEGDETRFVQPPHSFQSDELTAPYLDRRSRSMPLEDRSRREGHLVAQGVSRDYRPDVLQERVPKDDSRPKVSRTAASSQLSASQIPEEDEDETDEILSRLQTGSDVSVGTQPLPPFRSSRTHTRTIDDLGRRGHAHDPLEDQLFLRIGPSTFAGHSTTADDSDNFLPDGDDFYIVSESPGAADVDIYETAYRDEIERILAQAQKEEKEPQVFLTRRVDARLLALSGLAGKLMAHGEEAKSQIKDYTQFSVRKARVTEVSKALREAAQAEYEKRRQERKAWIESAKAQRAKAQVSPTSGVSETQEDTDTPAVESPHSMVSPPLESPHSSRTPWKSKAADRGRHAKTSVLGLVGNLKNKGRAKSKDEAL